MVLQKQQQTILYCSKRTRMCAFMLVPNNAEKKNGPKKEKKLKVFFI